MPSVEVSYSNSEVEKWLIILNDILKDDIIKQLIVNTINYNMDYDKKPVRFYKLRDEILPSFLGEEANKALFWFLLGGWLINEKNKKLLEKLDTDNLKYLQYLFYTYSKDFLTAKKFNKNPMGYDELNYSFGSNNGYNNLEIKRNDFETFVLSINDISLIEMVYDMVQYYTMLVENEDRKLSTNTNKSIDEIIANLESIRGMEDEKLS